MKDIEKKLKYKDKEYRLIFNLNVMQEIQAEYGTIDKWGELTEGDGTEPDAKAVIFGFRAMLNEGIDIDNEEKNESTPFLTDKQVGRLITDIGFEVAAETLHRTVEDSIKSTEKNE